MLRIVSGRYRGRRLETLPGEAVRPTSERVREAVFNRLMHGLLTEGGAPLANVRALDVFAGSGALGFEALSRGALHVTFMERDAAAARLIARNAERLGASGLVDVRQRDALDPPPAPAPARLLLMDAPYRSNLSAPALAALADRGWIAQGAVIVVEVARGDAFTLPATFTLTDERLYGAARVLFCSMTGP